MPNALLEDLEDYFDRLDASQRRGNGGSGPTAAEVAPTVPRFYEQDFARLRRVCVSGAAATGVDCAVCLQGVRLGDELFELPCEGRHRFHVRCLRTWLAKSVQCPICRTDVRATLRAAAPAPATVPPGPRRSFSAESRTMARQPVRRTRDGGRIVCYESQPPDDWQRPAYIPAHLHHLAQYLEVSYPNRGIARIWRVPNSATTDLSLARPPFAEQ